MPSKSKVTGVKELQKVLKRLPDRVARKVVAGALRSGATVIRREARRLAPVDTGLLRKSLIIKRPKGPAARRNVVLIGTSRKAPHGHLFEFGTVRMAARPFLRPAIEGKHGEALARMGQMLGRGVAREATRLAGSYAKSGLKARRR